MASKKSYYNAIMRDQNPSWQKMYEIAYNTFIENAIDKRTSKTFARTYTICYNVIFSGTWSGDSDIDSHIMIADVKDCVYDYFDHIKYEAKACHVDLITYQIYNAMFEHNWEFTFEDYLDLTTL